MQFTKAHEKVQSWGMHELILETEFGVKMSHKVHGVLKESGLAHALLTDRGS
jgi:transposase